MKKFLSLILISLLTINGFAENLYVRPGGTGNGTSWASAWGSLSSVVWGGGVGQVGGGDTLFVGAGTYSTQLNPTSGTASNPVRIRAAQDSYVGVATFSSVYLSSKSYVIVDGLVGKSKNFATTSFVNCQGSTGIKIGGFIINGAEIDFRFAKLSEVFNIELYASPSMEWCINFEASGNIDAYDQSFVINSYIRVNGKVNDGIGSDGIKPGKGTTISNTTLQSILAPVSNGEHQDLVQSYGNDRLKVIGCTFIDSGDAQLGIDIGSGAFSHVIIINNVFIRTINGMGTVGFRIYGSGGGMTSLSNFQLDNNTFVDQGRTTSSYGAAISIAASTSLAASNCSMRNNIFVNCGNGYPAVLCQNVVGSRWSYDYNLFYAGVIGNVDSRMGTQANPRSGLPKFVSYTPYSLNNDLHLSSSDTVAKDKGVKLTSFNNDKDGNVRGAVWDIGAYEAGGTTIPPVNVAPTVSLASPINNSTYQAGNNVLLSANASDSDGSVVSVDFYNGTVLLSSDVSAPFTFTLLSVPAGSHSFTAKATDNLGAFTTSLPSLVIATNLVITPSPCTNYVTNTVFIDRWFTNNVTNTVTINYTNYIPVYYTNTVTQIITNTVEVIPDLSSIFGNLNKTNKQLDIRVNFR